MRYIIDEKYQRVEYGDLVKIEDEKYIVCKPPPNLDGLNSDGILLLEVSSSTLHRVADASPSGLYNHVDEIVAKSIELILMKRS